MTPERALAAGPTATPTLHLHPLRRCNLACRHCYSHSSPESADALSRPEALAAIRQASAWGYTRLAVSGGEPLLYPWLGDCLSLAADLGMETALITNGLLLARGDNLAILKQVGTVSVSIDGLDESHNALRGRPRAFSGAVEGLAMLADAGIRFGIVCGVSAANLDEVEEVAATVHRAGASTLQLHPIAQAGRARDLMPDASLSADESTLLYVAASLMAEHYAGRLQVHTDLLHQRHVLHHPSAIYARRPDEARWDTSPAQLLGVLVVEPDGAVNPVSYGFARSFGLGNLRAAPMEQLWRRWLEDGYGKLLGLGRALMDELQQGRLPVVFNPSDMLRARSHRSAGAAAPIAWHYAAGAKQFARPAMPEM
jgi:MoaA/NifB/PqqE/SkfB family radical SAM enzyme